MGTRGRRAAGIAANAAMLAEQEASGGLGDDTPLTHATLKQTIKDVMTDTMKDTMTDTMQPLLQSILQPMLNDILQHMLKGLEEKLTARVEDVTKEFRPAIESLQTAVAGQSERIEAVELAREEMEARMSELGKNYDTLLERQIRLEDHSRRNTIRVIGLPEGSEGSNPKKFIQSFLQGMFEGEFPSPPEIDRAHRTGPQPAVGGLPRPFLARIHFFGEKERVMELSKNAGQLMYRDKKIFIFPDLSSDTSRRRAAFTDVKKSLREKGLRYGTKHPAKLWVESEGRREIFDTPAEIKSRYKDIFK